MKEFNVKKLLTEQFEDLKDDQNKVTTSTSITTNIQEISPETTFINLDQEQKEEVEKKKYSAIYVVINGNRNFIFNQKTFGDEKTFKEFIEEISTLLKTKVVIFDPEESNVKEEMKEAELNLRDTSFNLILKNDKTFSFSILVNKSSYSQETVLEYFGNSNKDLQSFCKTKITKLSKSSMQPLKTKDELDKEEEDDMMDPEKKINESQEKELKTDIKTLFYKYVKELKSLPSTDKYGQYVWKLDDDQFKFEQNVWSDVGNKGKRLGGIPESEILKNLKNGKMKPTIDFFKRVVDESLKNGFKVLLQYSKKDDYFIDHINKSSSIVMPKIFDENKTTLLKITVEK